VRSFSDKSIPEIYQVIGQLEKDRRRLKRVLGLGTGAMDTVIFCPTLPGGDSFQVIKSEQLMPGGSCANMLTTLASLGVESRLITKIGDDEIGVLFRSTLVKDGVDDRFIITKPGGRTLHTYVLADGKGQHSILVDLGDSLMTLEPGEIHSSILDGVVVFYSDLFPGKAAVWMANRCRETGIPVIICLQCPPSFMNRSGVSDTTIFEALSLADLIISGREGYRELTGKSDYQESLDFIYRKFQPRFGALCTAGDEGSTWQNGREILRKDAYRIIPIDSTGAGDSYLGALIYSYFIEGRSKADALEFASAVSAMKCLRIGPRIKINPGEVRSFIQHHSQR
jgi:sugar/nucleoside kinase (ribokinase family)